MSNQDIGHLIKMIDCSIKARIDREFKEKGVTFSQTKVLFFLHEKNGEATQKEIEKYLNVAHSTTNGLVSRLEKNGFVTVCSDTEDRRFRVVRATEKTNELANGFFKNMVANEERLVKSLDEDEIIELRRLLKILYENIK